MRIKTPTRWLGLLGTAVLMSSAVAFSDDSSTECYADNYSDGDCDDSNNRAECGYDGGDCCSCTCVSTDNYTCGVNGFACIDPAAECVDDDDVTVDMIENCGWLGSIGNGYCDSDNNKAECGYDGGDCCSCTCQTGSAYDDDDYACSADGSGFACIDPSAPCVDDDDVTVEMVEQCDYIQGIGNGYCDQGNNNAVCSYDGGDCCECTCQVPAGYDDDDYICSANGSGFACIDPAAPCVEDDDVTAEMVENCNDVNGLGDGYCDIGNNNAICGYDGGDCCECTCVPPENSWDDDDYICSAGGSGFACIDPAAPCAEDDDITPEVVANCDGYVLSIGNGYCDENNNNEACAYDGGDCCECTCVAPPSPWDDDDYQGCGNGFACIDPSAPCVNDDDITTGHVENSNCDEVSMGNAYCDERNNIPECNYDGGDCCSCTCEDTPNQECGRWGGFACIDPSAACVNDDDITVDMLDVCDYVGGIGNGYCDQGNNKPECNYDGGDCCECTCDASNGSDDDACGRWAGFSCIDPMAPCVDDDSVTVDMIDNCWTGDIGNGYCDDYNNNEECAFDGGDCCSCTCDSPADADDDWVCREFACIDPSATCVNDDDITTDMLENCGYVNGIGNGYCDQDNNKAECNYDGGDCCECTCEVTEFGDDESGGRWSGCNEFACIDPAAPCVDEDLITADMLEKCDYVLGIGNGYCDRNMNNEDCAYDGGDCCSCTCEYEWDDDYACSGDGSGFDCKDPSAPCLGEEPTMEDDDFTDDFVLSYEFVPWEQEGPLPTVDDAVVVGTKTEVSVTATAYDVRPGASGGDVGCGEVGGDGCAPQNTLDGIASAVESRWSCSSKLVEDEGPCQIEYTFAEPQNVVDIMVAFWKGDERIRTLKVHLNGVETHTHESYTGSVFNKLSVEATEVSTITLESVELLRDEWISIIEVLIFVTP